MAKAQPRRVWLHRGRAVAWVVFGVVSASLGWANSIALVWFASVYANVVSDWGAGEAADDSAVLARFDAMDRKLARLDEIDAKLPRLLDQ